MIHIILYVYMLDVCTVPYMADQKYFKHHVNYQVLCVACTGNVWENYMVIKDFEAEKDSNQLSLKKGETIQIIGKDDSGWWMATDGELAGWVPPSFIQPASTVMDSPKEEDDDAIGLNIPGGKVIDTEEYRAIDDYQGTEDSQVSFKEGDIVTVVDKEDDGEWSLLVCTIKKTIHPQNSACGYTVH